MEQAVRLFLVFTKSEFFENFYFTILNTDPLTDPDNHRSTIVMSIGTEDNIDELKKEASRLTLQYLKYKNR